MYKITTDLHEAMLSNFENSSFHYIGEMPIPANPVRNLIRKVLGKPKIKGKYFYYYGQPDERLAKIFQWDYFVN